jgi:hypothetical protein
MIDRGTLGGFTRNDNSFGEAEEPPEFKTSDYDDWYYISNGAKNGPVSAIIIKDLLNKKAITADTYVWRKAMTDWSTIRESDLEAFVSSKPPAISAKLIGNGFVWTLSVLPLVFSFINALIEANNQQAAALTWGLGFPYHPTAELPWQLTGLSVASFGWLDHRRLANAGYGSKWTRFLAVFLTPVYLFVRAKMLKQRPYYAITFIIMFVLGVLIEASVN